MVIEVIYTREQLQERARQALENIKKSTLLNNEKYIWKGDDEAFGMAKAMNRAQPRPQAK